MDAIDRDMQELQRRLGEGSIQRAYRGIVSFMLHLRTIYASQPAAGAVSELYLGYLDMTYFAFFPEELKLRNLKLAIVFNYESFCFEIWLAARNRQLQRHYWELFSKYSYNQHPLIQPAVAVDAIVSEVLAAGCSFQDRDGLAARIAAGVRSFQRDIVAFLTEVDSR